MHAIALKNISFLVTKNTQQINELQVARNLVQYFFDSNNEKHVLDKISGSTILKSGGKFYAYENYVLLKAVACLHPQLEIDFNIQSLRNRESLHEKIIARAYLDYFSVFDLKTVFSIEGIFKKEIGIQGFINVSAISKITGMHRSTIYKNTIFEVKPSENLKLDLSSELSHIPKKTVSK